MTLRVRLVSVGQVYCVTQGCVQAASVCLACAGKIESGAMINACSDKGEAQGYIDGIAKTFVF